MKPRAIALTMSLLLGVGAAVPSVAGKSTPTYDIIVRGGTVYDGTGAAGKRADVAIDDGKIVAIGNLSKAKATEIIQAKGKAVTPGFINMLSWATDSLIVDGRSQSDLRQGVTLEVMGEGWSMGPINEAMRKSQIADQGDIKFPIPWTTLGEYMDHLVAKGISTNVASYVGAATVRIYEVGEDNKPATPQQLAQMQDLVRVAMREGAMGVGSSLIYAPGNFASTNELVALTAAAHEYGGGYISHMRSEADRYLEGLDELLEIGRRTGAPVQMYHMKPAGEANWGKSQIGLDRMTAARKAGIDVTANIYPYTAGATGLDAAMPLWVQEGGYKAWADRLRDPATRARVLADMRAPKKTWESLYDAAGSPEKVLLIGFKNDALKPLTGMTLAAVAKQRGTSPEDTMIDLVIEDGSRVTTAYFLMSEENIRRNIAWPWTMVGSDEGSYTTEGVFLKSNAHPRAYGSFARFLGKYVRDEKVITLSEGIKRLTSLPAATLRLRNRGELKVGYAADVVVFDPKTIKDHATYDKPHQYATGVSEVIVNGVTVLRSGTPTDARPGQVVRGPGWTGWGDSAVKPTP
jgi:N-acyl-D-amino-acid deacylase